MTDHRFEAKTKAVTRVAAASWFVRLRGSKAREARSGFARWRLRNPTRARAYEEIETIWGLAGDVGDSPEISALVDHVAPRVARPAGRSRSIGVWGRRAACIAVVLGGVGIAMLSFRGLIPWGESPPATLYQTAVGEQRDVTLADGSIIRLDAATQVEVRLASRSRDVRLISGRARFTVAKAPGRPFIVHSGEAGVTALGTVFDVRREAGLFEVALFEGRVEVRRDQADVKDGRLILAPGQGVRVVGRDVLRALPLEAGASTGWVEGRLVFDGAPLSEVVAELNRYSPHKLSLETAPGDRRRFRGEFRSSDIDGAVKVLAALYDLSITKDQDGGIRLN
jgi:transmembrane sensor